MTENNSAVANLDVGQATYYGVVMQLETSSIVVPKKIVDRC